MGLEETVRCEWNEQFEIIRLTFHSECGWHVYGFEKAQAEKFLLKLHKKAKSRTDFKESKIRFETIFETAELAASRDMYNNIFDCLSDEIDYIKGVKNRPVPEKLYEFEEAEKPAKQPAKQPAKEVAQESEKTAKTQRKQRKQPAKKAAKRPAKKETKKLPSKKKGASKSKMVRKRRS